MAARKSEVPVVATRPFLITFSGIDGAGKTTQIEQLSLRLQKQGLRVLQLSFWDDIAALSEMRAGAGYRASEVPASRATAPSVVCAAFSPKRKSASLNVAYTSVG